MKRLLCLLVALLLLLPSMASVAEKKAPPRLMVEGVSPYDAYPGYVAGRVFREGGGALDTAAYKVAVYVFTSSAGDDANAYIKPTYAEPFTPLGTDGAFLTQTTTDHYGADNDRRLQYYRLLLLPAAAKLSPAYSETASAALDALTVTRSTDGTWSVAYDCGFAAPETFPQNTLVWADEFDGDALDTSRWNIEANGMDSDWLMGMQDYEEEKVSVGDGVLTLTAFIPPHGIDWYSGEPNATSGCISTRDIFATSGGRIEMRARCDVGEYLWPGAWMLPQDLEGEWPQGGELDLWYCYTERPTALLQCIQFSNQTWDSRSNDYRATYATGTVADWHTYAVEWTMGGIRWYVDGALTFGASSWTADEGKNPAPFDKPFYLGLSLTLANDILSYEEEGDSAEPDIYTDGDKRMQVDYVRVYQMGT